MRGRLARCARLCRSGGFRWISVKPSAQPTLVRTQHLPPQNPRSGPVYAPGLIRVRERCGRPLTVAVGQPWARSGQVSGLCRGGPERAGRAGSAVHPGMADVVSMQVRGHVADGGMMSGVQLSPAGSSCDTDAWRTGPGGPGGQICGPAVGRARRGLACGNGWRGLAVGAGRGR
jgi:hypothetical protein